MATENPQAVSRETFIFFFCGGEHYNMYYFFPAKQNVKYIFIDVHRRKEKQ